MEEQQDILQQMENWGYLTLHQPHPHSPGYGELLIALRKTPTGLHFDPASVRLQVCDEHGSIRQAVLTLEPFLEPSREMLLETQHVCPGMVIIRDRKDKRIDFFTFGGSLSATLGSGEAIYSLRSPAPILKVTGLPENVAGRLAVETEALIGESQAKWKTEQEEFLCQLAQADPSLFYIASVNSILTHGEEHPVLREEDPALYSLVHSERQWLMKTGQWPPEPPTLEGLLAPA